MIVPALERLDTARVRVPARLGPYDLIRELGTGAMGSVYLAEDRDEARRVALKVLHPHLVRHPGFFRRFQREAMAGQRVEHRNVVRTLDYGFHVVEGRPYCVLVMEYVRGCTLRALLGKLVALSERLVREIGRQVAAGLTAIHEARIVHRDLKPENVLIADDKRVRIMDLGVARYTKRRAARRRVGHFTGSLLYAAPEQLRGGHVGPAADLYAMGVMLYELASGVNPFRHDEPDAVIDAHLETEPERLDRRGLVVSPFLSEVVAVLLAKRPDDRFPDAMTLRDVLRAGERSPWWRARARSVAG